MKLPACNSSFGVGDLLVVDSCVWDDDIDPSIVISNPGEYQMARKLTGLPRGALALVVGFDVELDAAGRQSDNTLSVYVLLAHGAVARLSAWSLRQANYQKTGRIRTQFKPGSITKLRETMFNRTNH